MGGRWFRGVISPKWRRGNHAVALRGGAQRLPMLVETTSVWLEFQVDGGIKRPIGTWMLPKADCEGPIGTGSVVERVLFRPQFSRGGTT